MKAPSIRRYTMGDLELCPEQIPVYVNRGTGQS